MFFFFFFSSRRRHTRWNCDWSSDVCSSDLDPSMRDLLSTLERAASAESPVLVRGEMGTGRRLVARALHRSSPRASAPFVPVNCRLVPPDQLEDELFGHEKGAFAGAHARKPGLLELAESGVAFLQEVE